MIEEADIKMTITCRDAPGASATQFHLRYSGSTEEDGRGDIWRWEKSVEIEQRQSRYIRFSEGSVVQFGHIPRMPAWTGRIKRALDGEEGFYWGYHICIPMPTMGHRLHPAYDFKGQKLGYVGNQLFLMFADELSYVELSDMPFCRSGLVSKYDI